MTELQDYINHISQIVSGMVEDTDMFHIIYCGKETYEDWLEWASSYYNEEDDLSEHLLESIDGYSLYDLIDSNIVRLQLPNNDSYIINRVTLKEW